MSIVAPTQRRLWVPALAGVAFATISIAMLWALTGADRTSVSSSDSPQVAAPAADQARWRIKTSAARSAPITKTQRELIARRKPELLATVRNIYNTLFLTPSAKPTIVKEYFAPVAASSFRADRTGIPNDATDVRITRRIARIGIEAQGVNRAAALVDVEARATRGGRVTKLSHRARLWLQREADGWKVIAYDVSQRPRR